MIQRRGNLFFDRTKITLLAIIFICAFSLLYKPVRLWLTDTLYSVAPSIFRLSGSVGNLGSSFVTNFRDKQALVYENAMLRAENDRMQAQVLDRNLLQERVAKLEAVLGRGSSDNRVVADVVAGFGKLPYDMLVVDAGQDQGIQSGDLVVYAGTGVIGSVAEATTNSAKIKLFSSPGEEYYVLIGTHAIPATARGKGDGNFEAKVPQGGAVVVGDTVVVSRGNLILGKVQSIEQKPGVPFNTVFFRSSFNPTEIRTIEVILGSH